MPTLYGEVSSLHGQVNVPAINRINILAAHILCTNTYSIAFYAEENSFSILFYGQHDGNGRIFSETLNMDHSPRIEAEDEDDNVTSVVIESKDDPTQMTKAVIYNHILYYIQKTIHSKLICINVHS